MHVLWVVVMEMLLQLLEEHRGYVENLVSSLGEIGMELNLE